MFPSSFDQANCIFDKPEDMTYDECSALDTHIGTLPNGDTVVISCWKATLEELQEIMKTGRVWCFHYGEGLQPHALSGHNPFEGE